MVASPSVPVCFEVAEEPPRRDPHTALRLLESEQGGEVEQVSERRMRDLRTQRRLGDGEVAALDCSLEDRLWMPLRGHAHLRRGRTARRCVPRRATGPSVALRRNAGRAERRRRAARHPADGRDARAGRVTRAQNHRGSYDVPPTGGSLVRLGVVVDPSAHGDEGGRCEVRARYRRAEAAIGQAGRAAIPRNDARTDTGGDMRPRVLCIS